MKRAATLSMLLASCAATHVVQVAPQRSGNANSGIALCQEGRFAEAEVALRGATGITERAYHAASLAGLGRYAEAEPEATAVLEVAATQPVAVKALGESLVGQHKYDQAISRMTTALGRDARLAYAYYWRGQAYQHKKQIARMVDDFERFLRLLPDAPEAPAIRALLAGLR